MSGSADACDLPVELPPVKAGGRYWIAYSGGLDSTVLLHWLRRNTGQPLTAVHVNHGLQTQADEWVRHCRKVCKTLDVPLEVMEVSVQGVEQAGLEAAARQARYRALSGLTGPDDLLLTGHHRDDQAETLLLQLLRGSGPHGLAAMPGETGLGQGKLHRPLLCLSRDALLEYARSWRLEWIDDPSNRDTGIRRNFLRHKVMPLLSQHWPTHSESLARTAGLQAEAASLMDDLAEADMQACPGSLMHSLSVVSLRTLAVHRRRNLIRYWLRQQALAVPNQIHMRRIENDMLTARADANPVVNWGDVELRRYRDDLLAMPALPTAPGEVVLQWDIESPLQLPEGCGELVAESAQGAGLKLETQRLEVRFNQPGARIRPVLSRHNRRLKHLFQEAAVPPWVRERLPLIYHGDCLAAVADLWIAAEQAARRQDKGWIIHWRGAPVGWPVADE